MRRHEQHKILSYITRQCKTMLMMMMLMMMIPGCPVGSLGLAEGRAQVQPVRTSGESWRGACPMCQRKMARDDLWAAGS